MSEITPQNENFLPTAYNSASTSSKPITSILSDQIVEYQLPFKNKEKKVELYGMDRLKKLYPYTDIDELPLTWSNKDKSNSITLSDNDLTVHYKGMGKGHKDAASVRTVKPIPQSCLLYYYEIKVVCKGRDGYLGLGLAAENVSLEKLPGWDKHSYGYHGDDGHSFSSSGTGKQYGPTFTTDDVIGCGFNIVENKCFYTKNGFSLGDAFEDLVNLPLFPTVGLQTPGEEIEANFGLEPFMYDIQQEIDTVRQKLTSNIISFPVKYNEWQYTINKIIQSWLIHNGYYNSAEVFSVSSKQDFKVNVNAIKQRLKIQQLVLAGKIGEAIELTNKYYPKVLKENPNLLFALKCRQFIEMINGNDSQELADGTASSQQHTNGNSSTANSTIKDECSSMEVDYDCDLNHQNNRADTVNEDNIDKALLSKLNELNKHHYSHSTNASALNSSGSNNEHNKSSSIVNNGSTTTSMITATSTLTSTSSSTPTSTSTSTNNDKLEHRTKKTKNHSSISGQSAVVKTVATSSPLNMSSSATINFIKKDHVASKLPQLLEFGKELQALSQQLTKEYGQNEANEKMLCDAFSLIAYADPSLSAISWQLEPSQREQVCLQLNNAIIKSDSSGGCCQIPPLEAIIKQTKSLQRLNNNFGAWLIDKL